MPHSSGGGSHGGGSHGGHGGHGGASGPRISRSHFAGARRFSYHNRHGQQRYFYADNKFDPKFKPLRLLLAVVYLPFLFFAFMMLKDALHILPKNYDHSIIIEDEAGVINNRDTLYKELKLFMDKTGIAPSVVTVHNETWSDNYYDLERYAYDRYLQEFSDEMHWLIVYSEPAEPDPIFNDWYWEGMQGDYTDPVLTTENTSRFNSKLQSLLCEDKNFGISAEMAFRDLTDNFSRSINVEDLFTAIFILGFISFHAYFTLGLNLIKYRNAVPAPETSGTQTYSGTAPANQPIAYDYGKSSYSQPYSQTPTKRMDKNDMEDLFKTAKQMEQKGSFNEKIECPYCGITYSSKFTRCPSCNARRSMDTLQ